MNSRQLTEAFNIEFGTKQTVPAIGSALKNRGIKCCRAPKDHIVERRKRLFTPEQVEFIKKKCPGRSVKKLTEIFNEKYRSDFTTMQMRTFATNNRLTSGLSGRFKKGHIPANKGTKGLTGANSGSFKKGSVPPNRKPTGTERLCSKDGYVLIKIDEPDPYTGFKTRYKHKHIALWEKTHGPVPDGMVIAFRDGDMYNITNENLMMISRAELLRLNKHGYKNMPAEIKPTVLALAKLEAKTFSKQKKVN